MRSTTWSRCAALPGSSWPKTPFPTRARSCTFAICWRTHQLTEQIFAEVRTLLEEKKLLLKSGTIVDATIISAPSSTKNATKSRDPEMHQGKKNKREWHFGMKVHIGASKQGLGAQHRDRTGERGRYHQAGWIAAWRRSRSSTVIRRTGARIIGSTASMPGFAIASTADPRTQHHPLSEYQRTINRARSRCRARGEHAFHVVKRLWGFAKVRYRGLAKNTARTFALFALANLYLVRRRLLPRGAQLAL